VRKFEPRREAEMPTAEMQALREAINRFEVALDRVERLAATNEKLVRAYRRQKVIIIVLSVLLALVTVLGVVTMTVVFNLARNTEQDAKRNEAVVLDACRGRNATNVVVRKRFDNFYKALLSFDNSASFHQFVTDLRAKDEGENVIIDRDCTLDGIVDAADYPPDGGP
jgi:hypothetical protein